MQSLEGWNLSSAFLNLETEDGSSCATRFKGCQWTCLLPGGGSWFVAGVSYEANTQMKAKEERLVAFSPLVHAVQRQWYIPALPIGPLLAYTGSNQVSVTCNQKSWLMHLSQMVISQLTEIHSSGNRLTRKHSCYLDIVLNYKGILPTIAWFACTGKLKDRIVSSEPNIVKTKIIIKG